MVYDEDHGRRLNKLGEGLSGALAGGFSRFLVTPLDVLKIYFQLQVDPVARGQLTSRGSSTGPQSVAAHSTPHYRSMAQATAGILREGGVRGLWRGTVPATALWITYMAVQFPAYRTAQQTFGPMLSKRASGVQSAAGSAASGTPGLALSLAAGATSGFIATVLTYPLDWLRTRMAAQAHLPPAFRTSPSALVMQAWQAEGGKAFFRGLSPSLLQVVPSLAVTFATYEHAGALYVWLANKDKIKGLEQEERGQGQRSAHQQLRSLFAGGCAGVAGKLSVYPLDTVKKRLQMQSKVTDAASTMVAAPGNLSSAANHVPGYHYKGTMEALLRIAREEGVLRGWYKGTAPSLLKAGAAAALTFWSYEGAAAWLRTQSWAVDVVQE